MSLGRKLVALLALTAVCMAQDPDITFNALGLGLMTVVNGDTTTLGIDAMVAATTTGDNTYGGYQDYSLARMRLPITLDVPPANECSAATLGEVRLKYQSPPILYMCLETSPGTEQWTPFTAGGGASALAS